MYTYFNKCTVQYSNENSSKLYMKETQKQSYRVVIKKNPLLWAHVRCKMLSDVSIKVNFYSLER